MRRSRVAGKPGSGVAGVLPRARLMRSVRRATVLSLGEDMSRSISRGLKGAGKLAPGAARGQQTPHYGFGTATASELLVAKATCSALLAEALAPLLHVEVEMVLVGGVGIRSEHGAEAAAGVLVQKRHELSLAVHLRLLGDRRR